MFRRTVFSVILMLFSTACQPQSATLKQAVATNQTPSTTTSLQPYILLADNADQADDLLKQYAVKCQDPSKCPPGVGLLIARLGERSLGLCTSFLADAQTIVTNKHCLPESLMTSGIDCADLITFKFPAIAGYREAKAECASIVSVSPYSVTGEVKEQSDYAIIRLKAAVNRPPLKFDLGGVGDQQAVTVVRMSPATDKSRVGTIALLPCKAVQNTFGTPTFESNKSPVIQLADCPIVHGNSGSPILNQDGHVVAIIQQANESKTVEFGGRTSPVNPFARGTNFACVQEPEIGLVGSNDPACSEDLSDAGRDLAVSKLNAKIFDSKTINGELNGQFAQWSPSSPNVVQWQAANDTPSTAEKSNGEGQIVVPKPLCVLDSGWLDNYKSADPKSSSDGYLKSATLNFRTQRLSITYAMNRDYEAAVTEKETDHPATMTFSPAQYALSASLDVTITTVDDFGHAKTTQSTVTGCGY